MTLGRRIGRVERIGGLVPRSTAESIIRLIAALGAWLLVGSIDSSSAPAAEQDAGTIATTERDAPALAAERGTPTLVVFAETRGGNVAEDRNRRIVTVADGLTRIHAEVSGVPLPNAPIELDYFDLEHDLARETALFPDGSRATISTPLDSLPPFVMSDERREILGYDCRKATTEIRSNEIEVWFTTELGAVVSPSIRLYVPDAAILAFDQNGTSGFVAERIVRDPNEIAAFSPEAHQPFAPDSWGDDVDSAEYQRRVTESYVTRVTVFDREQISFGNEIVNPEDPESDGTFHFSKGTVIARKVTLPEPQAEAMVLAELTERSNGDAYDRTGSVFLIPTDGDISYLDALRDSVGVLPVLAGRDGEYQGIVATESYRPPLELIRFITPFGVGEFNARSQVHGLEWEDEARYVMDVTDLLPRLQGEVWIGAFIGNYDKGGHIVSLELRYYPWSQVVDTAPSVPRVAKPLFNTVNAMEMSGQNYGTLFASDTLRVEFELEESLSAAQLRYTTTGHGGWGGGDEFNPKKNRISLDGTLLAEIVPWRSDCGTFRRLNPSSGNFWNGLSSSDFSRSGWCPGTTVSPYFIPLGDLPAGRHVVTVAIDMGSPEGGSFSSWNVSGTLLGEVPEEEQGKR
ncbi:MAG: PNGase F N-terminal domain-containing protein [Candidatus Eisenbacteria bacterium]